MTGKRVIYKKLLTPEEALSTIEQHYRLEPLGVEEVDLEEAVGRVLAETLRSPIDIPPFSRSRVDGYAVRAEDTFGASHSSPSTLKLEGVIEAGARPEVEVDKGKTVEVATGAPIPPGADAVVMIEHTKREGQTIQIYKAVAPGGNVEPAGADVARGEPVAFKGALLTPQIIGAIAACGIRKVKVYRKVRVGIISTGVEIQSPGEQLEEYKVYDVNSYTLYTALYEVGCDPVMYGIVRDDEDELRDVIERAISECDVVLTSGSTSAGLNDMVYRILRSMGEPGIIVEGLNIKPGKRTIVAVIRGRLVFGLPGFPVSALMVFTHIVKPVLMRLSGRTPKPSTIRARLAEAVPGGSRRIYQPVVIVEKREGAFAYPVWGESSSIVRMSSSDGFVVVPENFEGYDADVEVEVNLFSQQACKPTLYLFALPDPLLYLFLESSLTSLGLKMIASTPERIVNAARRGHADIVALPTHVHVKDYAVTSKAYAELKGLGYEVIAGFSREFGIAYLKTAGPIGGDRLRLASTPREWDQLEAAVKAMGNVRARKVRVKTLPEARNLLRRGVVDGIVTTRYNAKILNLEFAYVGRDVYNFMAPTAKIAPDITDRLKAILSALARDVEEKLPGYSPIPEEAE